MGIKKLILLLLLPVLLYSQNGQIPARATMRGYYHLEGLTDASGNGITLTNNNTVAFNAGRFTNSANFGSSGTNKGLTYATANIMSVLSFANATASFWVKFNSTSNPTGNPAYFFTNATRLTSGAGASRWFCNYTVSGGNFNIAATIKLATGDATATYSIAVNTTNWYHIVFVKSGTTTAILYVNGIQVSTNTGSGANTTNVNSLYYLSIGNIGHTALANQGWYIMDEFIIEERVWSPSEIRKYYTQGLGRFSPR